VPGVALTAQEMKELCLKHNVAMSIVERLGQSIEALEAVQYGFDKETAITSAVKELKSVVIEIQKVVK